MAYIMMIAGIFGLDFVIKNKIERSVAIGQKIYRLHDKIIITKLYNKGAMLGLLKKNRELVKCLSTIMSCIMGVYFSFRLLKRGSVCEKVGSALVLGGGLSNTYDRIVRKYVVDYVSFPVKWKRFSQIVFNISDFFIFAGTILFCIGQKDGEE